MPLHGPRPSGRAAHPTGHARPEDEKREADEDDADLYRRRHLGNDRAGDRVGCAAADGAREYDEPRERERDPDDAEEQRSHVSVSHCSDISAYPRVQAR